MSPLDPLTPGRPARDSIMHKCSLVVSQLAVLFSSFSNYREDSKLQQIASLPPSVPPRAAATLAKMCAHLMRKLGQSVLWREHSHKSLGLLGLNLGGAKCTEILKIFPLSNPWGGDIAFVRLQRVFNFISPSLVLPRSASLKRLEWRGPGHVFDVSSVPC